ncbi:hypothetical protein ACHAWO_009516 [Cyclotella atomus]|uniref:Uncharacterized protein n=1 Tax=Cyclotella atomus TaxID=382360 RepID=A0ABD3NK68_9STRA
MSSSAAAQQQQPHQYNRGILPASTLNALDYLVDRINAASGHLSSHNGNDNSTQPLRALLVGTNEGVGLSRSLGTSHSCTLSSPDFSFSGNMSEEVLSSIETVWATLVSAASPHVMAGAANNRNSEGGHNQPPHPLLSPLQLGSTVRTVTACYDHVTLVHVHLAPLVVTMIASPEVNLGMIQEMAIPKLKVLLEPVRRALVRSRGGEGRVVVQEQTQQQQAVMNRQGQQQQIYSQGQMMHG